MPSTSQTRIVPAPPAVVWKRLRNFHDLSWAPNVITRVDAPGETPGDQVGAQRVLNGVFHETLHVLDDENHRMEYSIDEGPPPVSSADVANYRGVVQVREAGDDGGALVEWSSSWDSSSEEAVEFCGGIYTALLDELATTMANR